MSQRPPVEPEACKSEPLKAVFKLLQFSGLFAFALPIRAEI